MNERVRLTRKGLSLRTRISADRKRLKARVQGVVRIAPARKRAGSSSKRTAGKRRASYRLTRARGSIAPRRSRVLRQRLRGSKRRVRRVERQLRRALKKGRRVSARVTITLTDPAGNVRRVKRTVRID